MTRTKKYITGDYMEIEVFNVSSKKKSFKRATKIKESTPAQKKLNDKKSHRRFVRLVNSNFGKKDYTGELKIDDDHINASREELLHEFKLFIDRVRRLWKKEFGEKPFRYIYVISNHKGDDTDSEARPHIHFFMSGGISRDDIESKWKWGFANVDRLQMNEYGATGKALYMARQSKSQRSWGGSINLIKPEPIVSDRAITKRQMEKIASFADDGSYIENALDTVIRGFDAAEYVEKTINRNNKKKWVFTDCLVEYDGRQLSWFGDDTGEGMGYSLLIRMRREYPRYIC